MGEFFNTVISKMDKIPTGKKTRKDSLEDLRRTFNEEQNAESPEDALREKRRANMALAREAKKKKAEARSG